MGEKNQVFSCASMNYIMTLLKSENRINRSGPNGFLMKPHRRLDMLPPYHEPRIIMTAVNELNYFLFPHMTLSEHDFRNMWIFLPRLSVLEIARQASIPEWARERFSGWPVLRGGELWPKSAPASKDTGLSRKFMAAREGCSVFSAGRRTNPMNPDTASRRNSGGVVRPTWTPLKRRASRRPFFWK